MTPTQAEIASALQVDAALVTRYKARGMPVDSIEAAKAWKTAHVRPRAALRTQSAGQSERESDGDNGDYWAARTRREQAEADIAEFKRNELEGQLIRVDAVSAAFASLLASTRENLLQIPARLSPVLAAETDAAKVGDLIHAELIQALSDLTTGPDMLRPKPTGAEGRA